MLDPAIIPVSEQHAQTLLDEFRSRYGRDYDLRRARSCSEAESIAQAIYMKRVAAASGEGASAVPLVHAFSAPAPE